MTIVREHNFTLATARHVFLHPSRGVIFTADALPLAEAEKVGFLPLIMYGVSLPGLPATAVRFVRLDVPRRIIDVLTEFWNCLPELRGKPDRLRISRSCAAADQGFIEVLQGAGITVEIAASNDKSHAAVLRNGRKDARQLQFYLPKSLDELHKIADKAFSYRCQHFSRVGQRQLAEHWKELPFVEPKVDVSDNLDWTQGDWLSAWQMNVPANIPRYWDASNDPKLKNWLFSGDADEAMADPNSGDIPAKEPTEYFDSTASNEVSSMIHCWPGGKKAIADSIKVTVKEINWMIAGRQALPPGKFDRLLDILGFQVRHEYYEPSKACILIAEMGKHAREAYLALTHGGDLALSIDAVPDRGVPDPSWQYLTFAAHGSQPSVIMVPRGDRVSTQMPDYFMNYAGRQTIPEKVYRDIVATCAAVGRKPAQNIALTKGLYLRHSDTFDELMQSSRCY